MSEGERSNSPCTMESTDYKSKITAMRGIGQRLHREDVMDCFSEQVLRVFISEQGEAASPSKLFALLQASVDARKEIQELERGMDKEHFLELVKGGNYMASGVDKQTKQPIFWHRTGNINKGAWRYKYGSPRGKAFVR